MKKVNVSLRFTEKDWKKLKRFLDIRGFKTDPEFGIEWLARSQMKHFIKTHDFKESKKPEEETSGPRLQMQIKKQTPK
jgi:hypothetical protein